jgi:hypothetical protein
LSEAFLKRSIAACIGPVLIMICAIKPHSICYDQERITKRSTE